MQSITLLGPQFRTPNLRTVLEQSAVDGPLVSITAGWQEREGELEDLSAHLDRPVEDLQIYAQAERLFATDTELAHAHRARQQLLQELRETYLLRLQHAKEALRALFAQSDTASIRVARRQALSALRRLDRAHLRAVGNALAEHQHRWEHPQRDSLATIIAQLQERVQQAAGVLIAGGHVAVLLNRLRLFGGASLLANKPLFAWSAGAMVLCETVTLFHDQPPQGAGDMEVFDLGLGLLRGVQVFPHAATRVKMEPPSRVAMVARRFAPSRCLTLDEGSHLHFAQQRLIAAHGCRSLARDGTVREL